MTNKLGDLDVRLISAEPFRALGGRADARWIGRTFVYVGERQVGWIQEYRATKHGDPIVTDAYVADFGTRATLRIPNGTIHDLCRRAGLVEDVSRATDESDDPGRAFPGSDWIKK